MCKVIVSQKKESTESLKRVVFKTESQAVSCWRQNLNISILPEQAWENLLLCIGLNENANSFFGTRCCFWSVKNSCFPGNAVHKWKLL